MKKTDPGDVVKVNLLPTICLWLARGQIKTRVADKANVNNPSRLEAGLIVGAGR